MPVACWIAFLNTVILKFRRHNVQPDEMGPLPDSEDFDSIVTLSSGNDIESLQTALTECMRNLNFAFPLLYLLQDTSKFIFITSYRIEFFQNIL